MKVLANSNQTEMSTSYVDNYEGETSSLNNIFFVNDHPYCKISFVTIDEAFILFIP